MIQDIEGRFMIEPNSRVLIIRMSAIGDVIETLPAVHALRKRYPEAYLVWVLERGPYSLLKGHPDLDGIVLFPKQEIKAAIKDEGLFSALKRLREFGDTIRRYNADISLDMQNLFKSGLVGLLSGAKQRIGFRSFREGSYFFLTDRLKPPKRPRHFVDWQLDYVRRLGADPDEVEFVLPDYSKEERRVEEYLQENRIDGDFFCLAPGTSWPSKCWTAEGMAQLADGLSEYGRVIIVGSESDQQISSAVMSLMQKSFDNAVGWFNLRELAVLLKKATLFFSGDTGPMHLAVAMGTPVITWLGPTSRELTGPYQKEALTISAGLPCQPCYKRRCKHNRCMKGLTFETVWTKVEPYLRARVRVRAPERAKKEETQGEARGGNR
jgi:heptosyltransferase-1